jgi:exopolysaccharide biosynthesis polyprenyl glycosylphosphotransferase
MDALMIATAFWVAFTIRFDLQLSFFYLDIPPVRGLYQTVVLVTLPLWILLFAMGGLYRRHNLLGGVREYASVFRNVTIGLLIVVIAGFLAPEFILARGWLLLSWVLMVALISFGRFCLRRVVYLLRYRGYFLSPALIIGANEEAQSLAAQLTEWRTSGLQVYGFVDDTVPVGETILESLPLLGRIEQLEMLVEEFDIEEIIIAASAVTRDEMVAVFKQFGLLRGINLRLSSGLFELITTGIRVKELAHVPLVEVNTVRLTGVNRLLKLGVDYGLTLISMVIVLPIMLVLAILVKLDSPGPVIHRRRVMGMNGRQFDAFKFRTMSVNGDEILAQYPDLQRELEESHKLKDDPRVTHIGRTLRKLSLDELPQLFNVLRREMSLVGPRMISPPEMEEYGQWGMNLLTVRPGLTGLWQVSGRSDVTYEDRVRLDMHYIRNWNLLLDLQIIFQTIPAVIRSRGAY